MSIPDDQIALLQAAVNVLTDLQTTATGAGAAVVSVTMEFPPAEQQNLVLFQWNNTTEHFDISTLTPVAGRGV